MWQWLAVVLAAWCGYWGTAVACGVGDRSPSARVGWAIVQCLFVVGYLFVPLFVAALSGVARGIAAVSPSGAAFFAGVAAGCAVAFWVRVPAASRQKVIGAIAAGVCIAIAAAWSGSNREPGAIVPAVVSSEKSNSPVQSSENPDCACADGAVCVGPRGGRYCIAADGRKHYQ